jgi:uncharacterized membrane protein YkvA (DUF1232 family)
MPWKYRGHIVHRRRMGVNVGDYPEMERCSLDFWAGMRRMITWLIVIVQVNTAYATRQRRTAMANEWKSLVDIVYCVA